MAVNLIDEYKKKLSSFGQGLTNFVTQNPLPAAYASQQFQQKVAQPIANTIKPYAQQAAQGASQAFQEAVPAATQLSPPGQLFNSYKNYMTQANPLENAKTQLGNVGKVAKAYGYATNPTGVLSGGLFGAGIGAATGQNPEEAFRQGLDFSATLSPISSAVKELTPVEKALQDFNLRFTSPVGQRFIAPAIKGGATQAIEGGLYGAVTGQNPLKTAGEFGVMGAATGGLMREPKANAKGFAFGKNKNTPWSSEESRVLANAQADLMDNLNKIKNPKTPFEQDQATQLIDSIDQRLTELAKSHLPSKTVEKLANDYGSNTSGYLKAITEELQKSLKGYEDKGGIVLGIKESNIPKADRKTSQMLPEARNTETPNLSKVSVPSGEVVSPNASTMKESIQQGQELLKQDLSGQTSQGGSGIPPEQSLSLPGSIPQKDPNTFLSGVKSKLDKIYTEAIDRFHPLSKIAKNAGEDQAMRNALTGYYGTGSIGQYHVDFELKPILREHDIGDLRSAAIAMRDLELAKRGIRGSNLNVDLQALAGDKNLDSQSASALGTLRKLQEKLGPERMKSLGETLNKLYSYQDQMTKKYLVDTGIMSKDAYTAIKANNQFYVPFKRVMDQVDEFLGMTPGKGAGSISSQDVVKGIKGSDKAIQDPLESIVEATYKMVGLAKRQEVAKTLVNLAPKLPEGMITKIHGPVGGKSSISLFENGKVQHYAVPPEVADAAKGLSEEGLNTMIKILSYPTKIFRASATGMNPEFMAPNVARDLQSAFVNTGLNPLQWVRGLAHQIRRDDVYQEFLKSGGLTSRVALDRSMLRNTVEDVTRKGLTLPKPSSIVHVIEALGEYSEQPTRIAMFENALKKGIKQGLDPQEAAIRAANTAQEGTVNFARRGSKTQSINAIYAFLNARVQGIDRLIRTVKNDPKGASLRIGMATAAPAIALYAHNRGYQSYNDPRVVTQNDKDNNFIIMLSDTPIEQLGGAQFIKIPKGEIGKLANPIESFMSFADGKGGDVQASLLGSLKAFSPIDNVGDIVPTALRPPVENAANYSFFSGQQIVPDYKKNYPAGYQSTSYTSPIYRMIGEKLGVSPAQIQNIIEGYATGWAKIGSTVADIAVPDKYKSEKNLQGQTINKTPLLRRFIGGEKRTPEEQQAIDDKKKEAIKYQVNDIKGAVNRGDIPVDVGIQQIQKLENNPNAQYYIDSEGKLKTADLTPIVQPKLTGQQEVDSLLLKDYSTQLNSQVADIVALNRFGKLDDATAREKIRQLELNRFKASARAGTQTQIRTLEQLKKLKDLGAVASEQNQALKDFQSGKFSASDLNTKIKTLKVKKIKLGGGKKPKKIKLPKVKKPKKIKVKKIKIKKT